MIPQQSELVFAFVNLIPVGVVISFIIGCVIGYLSPLTTIQKINRSVVFGLIVNLTCVIGVLIYQLGFNNQNLSDVDGRIVVPLIITLVLSALVGVASVYLGLLVKKILSA
jgi:hypothetical protein